MSEAARLQSNLKDPNRIDEMLKLISEIWHKHPDMRLCQLIGNCFSLHDLYYIEDDILQRELQKRVDEIELVEKFLDNRKE